MRALLGLVLLTAIAHCQVERDWLGMTPTQVERMGRAKFVDEFSTKHGSSTMAMCDAEGSYGEAVRALNQAWVKKHAPANRELMERIRPLVERFKLLSCEVGSAISGGGTMWNPVYASILGDVEELTAELYGRRPLSPGEGQAAVWKLLATAEHYVKQNAESLDELYLPERQPSKDAIKALQGMRSLTFEIAQESGKLSVAERRAVFGSLAGDFRANLDMSGMGI
ncbi:MAG: hypothetical protein AB7F50_06930 [Fimbriimonadaceae bacterium]